MKKTMRKIAALALVIFLLAALAVPALADGFDFGPAIEEFESDGLNTISLVVGQTHLPGGGVWAQSGMATCYSSDESVVVIDQDGLVTAVGVGTAYVSIDVGAMYDMYCYHVTERIVEEEKPGSSAPVQTTPPTDKAQEDFGDKYNDAVQEQERVESMQTAFTGVFGVFFAAVLSFMGFVGAVFGLGGTAFILLGIVMVLVRIGLMIWVMVIAPKSGMSKAWGLLALVSAIAGVVLLVIMYKKGKKESPCVAAPAELVCSVCGEVHPEGAKFCRKCGNPLQ